MAPNNGDAVMRAAIIIILIISSFILNANGLYTYSKEDLYSLRPVISTISDTFCGKWDDSFFVNADSGCRSSDNVNNNKRTRKRGKRGGHLVKSRRKFDRTPLPTMILSNVNRLFNKCDELSARFRNDRDFIHSQVICFTETWLTKSHPDDSFKPNNFSFFRNDRDRDITQKDDGGGVCFFYK